MNNLTVLVNTCDKYESAWDPFFRLLVKQWPECKEYNFVLNSETKVYNCDFLNVKTICGGTKLTWSARLKNVLKQIDTEYILYFLEDFFLLQKVNNNVFSEALDYIKSDHDVGYIGLKYSPEHIFKEGSEVDLSQHFLNKDDIVTVNRVNSMTALWRKDWLLSLLRSHETPWEFEVYGSVRSRRSNMKVLKINNINDVCGPVFDYGVDVKYGYGITRGKWLPENVELFKQHGIDVDFDILGIDSDFYLEANGNTKKSHTIKDTKKQGIRESLYAVKHGIKIVIRKIKKTIRKIRSLV